jgi:hypothetical protein
VLLQVGGTRVEVLALRKLCWVSEVLRRTCFTTNVQRTDALPNGEPFVLKLFLRKCR